MVMSWSYFKSDFSGKPEEDPEKHFLKNIDWMVTYNFVADQRLRFPLTLAGEVRFGTNPSIHFKVMGRISRDV